MGVDHLDMECIVKELLAMSQFKHLLTLCYAFAAVWMVGMEHVLVFDIFWVTLITKWIFLM